MAEHGIRPSTRRVKSHTPVQEAMNDFSIDSGLILTYDQEGEEEAGGKSIRILPVYKWMLGME